MAPSIVRPPIGSEKHNFPSTSISQGLFVSMVVREERLLAPAYDRVLLVGRDGEGRRDRQTDAAMRLKRDNRLSLLAPKEPH